MSEYDRLKQQKEEILSGHFRVFNEIRAERTRQDLQWGGADHDDGHSESDWLSFIESQITKARFDFFSDYRSRYVKIAALAVAAIESIDRKLQPLESAPADVPFSSAGSKPVVSK